MGSGERFYHDVSLRGPVPDRLLVRLGDPRSPDPDLARRLGEVAKSHARDFFAAGSAGFAYAQSFAWLGPLSHDEDGRHVAGALFEAWLEGHGRYAPRAWSPVLAAQRTEAMLAHAPLLLEGRDAPMREQVFGTLIRQVRHLAKSAKRAPAEGRLAASAGLMAGALALPGAGDQERAGKSALEAALGAFANGQLPDGLRRPGKALRLSRSLLSVRDAYRQRGLTPPPSLGEALNVLRLLLGGLALPEGDALAVLPDGKVGDPGVLGALSLLRRPAGDRLLSRYGYARLSGGAAAVHVDLEGAASGAFALSDGPERVVTAAGAPGVGLRAVSLRMRDWTEALSLPAAAATLDAVGFEPARISRGDADEGASVSLVRRGPDGTHERQLFLGRNGDALLGEDEVGRGGAVYRFPLAPGTEVRLLDGRRALLVLPGGRSWRFETAHAELAAHDGVFAGGGAPRPTRQLVVTAEKPGLRWAFRRV